MAGQSHGFDNTVVFGTETEYGVKATTFGWADIIDSFEPEENNNTDQRMSVGVRAPFMLRQGQKEVDASYSGAIQTGKILGYGLGDVTTTGDDTTGYTHTIKPIKAGRELPSFTAQNNNALLNYIRNYIGGKVDTVTVTASSEEAVTIEGDFMFQYVETEQGGTPAVVVPDYSNYFMFYEGSVKVNNTSIADITEFELELSNNLERRFTLNGQNKPQRIEEGNLEITTSLTMDFTRTDLYEMFLAGDNVALELKLVDSTNPDRTITFTLEGGQFDTNTLPVSAEDLQEQEMEAIFADMTVVITGSGSATLI
ncbi:major tail protein [Bacillus phage 056SW001B]|uniref:Major tail protein n=2 Tax=Gettysburgvirus TaxID=3425034 RepID=A0A7T7ZAL0_9CAUD|nr:major tail protein [Bacillus phage 276BB001]QFG05946.1 major tail protein [Bacillus phage 280BB001]QFR56490.1 major tail protein [Bacillus phage 056SW001B]QQO40370.1 major tail protein [Bacillus phage 268TH004]QZA70095.1 major tail protein [Bacillus phage 274BB002]